MKGWDHEGGGGGKQRLWRGFQDIRALSQQEKSGTGPKLGTQQRLVQTPGLTPNTGAERQGRTIEWGEKMASWIFALHNLLPVFEREQLENCGAFSLLEYIEYEYLLLLLF